MSNFLQTLFNTNHDQPSFLVFVVLAFIALVVPNLSKYLYESGPAMRPIRPAVRLPPARKRKRRKSAENLV